MKEGLNAKREMPSDCMLVPQRYCCYSAHIQDLVKYPGIATGRRVAL